MSGGFPKKLAVVGSCRVCRLTYLLHLSYSHLLHLDTFCTVTVSTAYPHTVPHPLLPGLDRSRAINPNKLTSSPDIKCPPFASILPS